MWPRYRSSLPCRGHKTSLKLEKDHMAGQGNRVLNTYVFEARSDVDEMKGLAVCPLGLKRQSINDEASRSCYQHLVERFPELITSLAPVFLMGGATKPVLHECRFPCTKGFRYHVRGSNCLSRSILANQPSSEAQHACMQWHFPDAKSSAHQNRCTPLAGHDEHEPPDLPCRFPDECD